MLSSGYQDDNDVTDFYCGIGGSLSGLVEAGWRGRLAANHSAVAIQTHSANHPTVEHLLGDIQAVDLRYLPRTRMLWASPICTELSPSGGRRRKGDQRDLFEDHGHVPTEAFERTRVTFWEVIRATEIHRYDVVLIENVVEAATWELFDVWMHGMTTLGYQHQFISVSAAHIWDEDNAPAPQWRDRMYIGFFREGIPMPDLQPTPLAWCATCDAAVSAVQWWKPSRKGHAFTGRRIGKYGKQYLYVCPVGNHGTVEPYVAPAIAAIDWTDLGVRIGDRESLGMRKLGKATMKRIELGYHLVGLPALVASVGNTYDSASGSGNSYVRAWPLEESPTPAATTTQQFGMALPEPFVTMLRANGRATGIDEPLRTFSTSRHHGLTIPPGAFILKQYGGRLEDRHAVKPVTEPLHSTVAESAPVLVVIPYRKGSKPHLADGQPISTMATREAHAVLTATVDSFDVDDCYFRMFKPRESANAQRFIPSYILTGNKGEQQVGAGNAVPVNVAHYLGRRTLDALDGRAA